VVDTDCLALTSYTWDHIGYLATLSSSRFGTSLTLCTRLYSSTLRQSTCALQSDYTDPAVLTPACITFSFPHQIASILPQPIVDYPQQTTRTAVDLVFTGTLRAHPHVKPILSHSGGTLPYLADRVCGLGAEIAAAKAPELNRNDV
jgi:hypothetical protein